MSNRNIFAGGLLVGIGVLLLLSNLGFLSGLWFLYALSLGFLAAYFMYQKHIGFIIPGTLVGALALFATINERGDGVSGAFFFFFFAAAFFAVYLIHTMHLKTADRGERIWPLFPGLAMGAVGILIFGVEQDFFGAAPLQYLNMIIPIILIAVGANMLVKNKNRTEE